MAAYPVVQLDVFTEQPLEGNPLAVFPEPAGLLTERMQALAREMNLSETTFVLPSDVATRRVRFFTPTDEIPLAGHPTIGTWWHLAESGALALAPHGTVEVTQETGAGVLPVEIVMANGRPQRVVMTQATPTFGKHIRDRAALGAALGGTADMVGEPVPQVVSTALPQAMIPVPSLEQLQALPVGGRGSDLAALLQAHGTNCAMCFSMETVFEDATVHCRMFAPGLGVPEDPATGSAAGALGAYLVRHGLVDVRDGQATIVVEQGLEIGRPSRIHVAVQLRDGGAIGVVRVGGAAVTVMTGVVVL